MRRDGRWVPTFPNAKYLFSRAENEYGDPRRNPRADADPQRSNAYRDSVLPVIESGQAELIDGSHAIDDALLIEPAPGHTVGHVISKLAEADERALFCGDVVHHPLQVYAPHWNSGFCELAGRGARDAPSRAGLLRRGARAAVPDALRRPARGGDQPGGRCVRADGSLPGGLAARRICAYQLRCCCV